MSHQSNPQITPAKWNIIRSFFGFDAALKAKEKKYVDLDIAIIIHGKILRVEPTKNSAITVMKDLTTLIWNYQEKAWAIPQ